MTLDELMKVYSDGFSNCLIGTEDGFQSRLAGIRAVVTALRDEVVRKIDAHKRSGILATETAIDATRDVFNEILANNGMDKAAGKDTAVEPEAIERSAPAAAPVCEWTDGGEHWETSCGDRTFHWSSFQGKIFCHVCGKLIEFKDTSK